MIPLIMNNKNKCREEINRSTSDITGAGAGGSPRTYKSTRGRRGWRGGRGTQESWDGADGDSRHWWVWGWGGYGGGLRGAWGVQERGSSLLPWCRCEWLMAWQECACVCMRVCLCVRVSACLSRVWPPVSRGSCRAPLRVPAPGCSCKLGCRAGHAPGAGQRRQPLASGAQAGAGAMFISQRKLVSFSCKNPNFQSLLPPHFPPSKVSPLVSLQGGGLPSLGDTSSLE